MFNQKFSHLGMQEIFFAKRQIEVLLGEGGREEKSESHPNSVLDPDILYLKVSDFN